MVRAMIRPPINRCTILRRIILVYLLDLISPDFDTSFLHARIDTIRVARINRTSFFGPNQQIVKILHAWYSSTILTELPMMVEKFPVNTYDSALRYFRHIGRLEQMAKKWAL